MSHIALGIVLATTIFAFSCFADVCRVAPLLFLEPLGVARLLSHSHCPNIPTQMSSFMWGVGSEATKCLRWVS